jgi:hypothetical protein
MSENADKGALQFGQNDLGKESPKSGKSFKAF